MMASMDNTGTQYRGLLFSDDWFEASAFAHFLNGSLYFYGFC